MLRILAIAAIVLAGSASAWADEPAIPAPDDGVLAAPGAAGSWAYAEAGPEGKYFIGVACAPVPPPLRKHLPLDDGVGVMVLNVMPDTPAAKAGIEPFDVLVRAGDQPLHSPAELAKLVEETGDKDLHLVLIHQGKETEIDVKPVERPAEARRPSPPEFRDPEEAARWLEHVWPEDPSRAGMRLRFFNPGFILPEGAPAHAPLPGNLSIGVTKKGDQPAEIRVQRGDETWTVKETELDKLPEDIRPHVQRMLGAGQGRAGAVFGFAPDVRWTMPRADENAPGDGGPRSERLERQLREVKERLDRITEELSELRKDRAQEAQPADPER